MLDKFLKKAIEPDTALVAGQAEQIAQLSELVDTANQMIEQLEADIVEKDKALQEALDKLAGYEAAANEAKAIAEAAAKEAAELKVEQRKEKLADVIGAENPEFASIFEAISGLEDAAFDVIVGGYKQQVAALEASDMFKEVGLNVDVPSVIEAQAKEQEGGMNLKQFKKKK